MIEWYNVYNKATFEAEDLVSKELTLTLGDLGEQDVLLTKGNGIGITFDGVFVMLELEDQNPFLFNDHLGYLDEDDEIWLGIASVDED